jgi:hypothetical protein
MPPLLSFLLIAIILVVAGVIVTFLVRRRRAMVAAARIAAATVVPELSEDDIAWRIGAAEGERLLAAGAVPIAALSPTAEAAAESAAAAATAAAAYAAAEREAEDAAAAAAAPVVDDDGSSVVPAFVPVAAVVAVEPVPTDGAGAHPPGVAAAAAREVSTRRRLWRDSASVLLAACLAILALTTFVPDTPTLGFIANSTLGSTVPARLSWCGVTRSGSSVRSYTVGQSTNGGSSYASTPIVRNSTVRSTTRNLTVGKTYRWRARTTDSAGRAGAYKASLTSRIARFQESSTAFVYAGAWSRTATSNAAGGAQQSTSTAGASATITLTNVRQFAVVGPRSAGRGSFEVRVDGALVAIVSEKATTTVYRRVLYVRSLTSGPGVSHVIEIRAVGNGRIDLDAILALS